MRMPTYLTVGTLIWIWVSMWAVPRFVRSFSWVAIITLVSGSVLVWARYRAVDDPFEIKLGVGLVLLVATVAVLMSGMLARREERLQRRRERQGKPAPLLTDWAP